MSFRQISKSYAKYIVVGLQGMIMFIAVCGWLFNRGNSYSKVFTVDEYILSDNVTVTEVVSLDASAEDSGEYNNIFLSTPPLDLKRGIYNIQIDYTVDCPGSSVFVSSGLSAMEVQCSPINLDPSAFSASMVLQLDRADDDVVIRVAFSGQGHISILNIGIYETSHTYKKNIFYAVFLCLLISVGYLFMQSDIRIRKISLALSCIFLVSCYPLYTNFLTVGHDLPFHLLRIEAISQGLSNGVFPVKLHPLWAREHGYAVGIFYGDALLYFPAFLRLLGFSIQSAYKFFVAFINLGTILLSYYAFRGMFSSDGSGLLGCLAYALAPYRLMDLYTRAAVGEYTAMMFLPLVLYGFYMIFRKEHRGNWPKAVVLTALGMSGVIHSHVLSSLMICFVALAACLVLIRRVFDLHILRSLACAAGLTLVLSLNFIVPFLDFYREDLMINSPDWAGRAKGSFQAAGLFPIQLFALFQHSNGGAWDTSIGINEEATYSIGILLVIGLFLLIYLLCIHHAYCRNNRNYRAALLCALLGCLLCYMSTCYFPWGALASLGSAAKSIIDSFQFPWRFLAPATVLLTFALCYSFDVAKKALGGQWNMLLTASLILLTVNCGWYFFDFSFSMEPYRVYTTSELYTMQMYSYEYLPTGTDPEAILTNAVRLDGASLESYQRKGTSITCDVSAQPEGGHLELPLIYYKYYRCTDIGTSQDLPVCVGTNNVVRVILPANYAGTVHVRFVEPWFWRLSEIVSCIALVSIAILFLAKGREKSKCP